MPFKSIAAALLALALAACNPMAQLDGAEQQIDRFQSTYNAGNARALYGLTAREFRDVSTAEQMDGLVELVSGKLGQIESSERAGFNINTNNGQTTSTVTMTTQFENGEATETYTFFGTGDDLRIVGWNVDSEVFQDEVEEAEAQQDDEAAQ